LGVAYGRELTEILVALEVTGEQNKMVVCSVSWPTPRAITTVSGCYVGFHPDDRLETLFSSHLVEIPRAKHAAVVGQGERRHFVFRRLANEVA